MSPRKLFRTYGFRIALLYIGLFAVSLLVLFGVIFRVTASFMEDQIQSTIGTEMASLVHDLKVTDIGTVADVVAQRTDWSPEPRNFYLLQDAAGQRVSGNLPAMAPVAGWQEMPIPADLGGEDSTDTLIARGKILSNGWFLLVGQDTDRYTDFEELITNAAGLILAAALGLGLVGGLTINARMRRRIDIIAGAGRNIMQGNLSHRIPLRGTGDEFDRLSANLNEMLDRIQMLMEGLRQLSNDIAHDLRTPLTRLRQNLEGARRKATTVAEYQTLVDKAIAETDEILHTFGALLRIAQIEAGTRRAGFTEVDLSNVLQTIAETYAAVAEDHRQTLASRISDRVTVRGDRQLLTQMIANIVENALRHTPAGTRIEIELNQTPAGAVCTIADNGPGIPEDERPKVFRRFYRLESGRAMPGNGLGLSLVAAVADLHKIAVEIGDNRPGLRVTLRFPPLEAS